nr:MAG: hypothetical protein 1 [Leviviridae sp.]
MTESVFRRRDLPDNVVNVTGFLSDVSQPLDFSYVTIYGRDLEAGFFSYKGKEISIPIAAVEEYSYPYYGRYYGKSGPFDAAVAAAMPMIAAIEAEEAAGTVEGFNLVQWQKSGFMEDYVTPDFHKRKNAGEIINNPMRQDVSLFHCRPSSKAVVDTSGISHFINASYQEQLQPQNIGYRYGLSGSAVVSSMSFGVTSQGITQLDALVDQLSLDSLRANAINTMQGKIDEGTIDTLTMLAESKDTFSFVTNRLLTIAKLLVAFKKGNFSSVAPKTFRRMRRAKKHGKTWSLSKSFAEAWLEVRYALMPLVYDVNGAIKVLSGENALTPRKTFRGWEDDMVEKSFDVSYYDHSFQTTVRLHGVHRLNGLGRAGAIGESRHDNDLAYQLGLFNVATTAWELVPFSFVVDWFINIGSTLNALNPNPTWKILASWVKTEYTHIFDGFAEITLSNGDIESVPFMYTISKTNRDIAPKGSPLSVDVNLNTTRLIDALSLVRTVGLNLFHAR